MKLITVTHGPVFYKRYDMLIYSMYFAVFRRTHWLFGVIPIWTRLWRP
jgi:hypothetical protein